MADLAPNEMLLPDPRRFGRVAIVHDWLVTYAGSERVLEQIIRLGPDA